jgi:hypothetical protein
MQRTPSAPAVAACAVCGGRSIVSPGPSLMSPLAGPVPRASWRHARAGIDPSGTKAPAGQGG